VGLALSYSLTIVGVVSLILGVALIYVPAALILGGVIAILLGAFIINIDRPTAIEETEEPLQ
jgi:hypothetical protein